MFAPTRILAPVDFSGASEAALRWAIDLAARTGAELHVLHVVPGSVADGEEVVEDLSEEDRAFYRRLWEEADEELTALLDRVSTGEVRAKRVLSRGVPARVALDYAEKEEADLLVMGTHGRSGLRRLFLGSVAEEVLRRTRVPVLIVPEASRHTPIRLVLAPTDFSDASREALPVAAGLAALYGADLDLVHALEPIRGGRVAIPASSLPGLQAEAERQLEALAEDPDLAAAMAGISAGDGGRGPARIGHHLVEGRAAETIAEFAQSRKADAIVMAPRGLHGVERLLLGSVTERVCRLGPCPILVVPIEDHHA
jgi:nucleotide-binding universal stress UspA family protein